MNGLIFPYRLLTDQVEAMSTLLHVIVDPAFGWVKRLCVGSVVVVGEHRSDAGG